MEDKLEKKLLDKIKLNEPFFQKDVINNIFSFYELEKLINLTPFINTNRLNVINLNENVRWQPNVWISDNCIPPNILQDLVNRHVCYIRDCSRVNKKINDICNLIEQTTDYPTDAHIFFSIKTETEMKGFGKHNDNNTNLIVQVEGKSNIKVWSKKDEVIIDEEMTSGDCVFIPAKINHQITSLEPRLSVSFPMLLNKEAIKHNRDWIQLKR